eukprot:5234379-Alexandrium_andersonii.AAC.1
MGTHVLVHVCLRVLVHVCECACVGGSAPLNAQGEGAYLCEAGIHSTTRRPKLRSACLATLRPSKLSLRFFAAAS